MGHWRLQELGVEGEEENAPLRDGFLEEVTLNGGLKNELEGRQ